MNGAVKRKERDGMNIRTMYDLDFRGKRVLIRVDYNVPMDNTGSITDDTRIRASVPTIRKVIDGGGRVILMSHLGRPDGVTESLRLKPAAVRLGELLGAPVESVEDCVGPIVAEKVGALVNGSCLLLENVRFYPEETANDPEFSRLLAASGDVYINDAFGSAHRTHASTEGITHHIGECTAGLLMQRELAYLSNAIETPRRPMVVILGGAKVSDKIGVTRRALELADTVIIGGGMAYTFLKSSGMAVGGSLVDHDSLAFASEVLDLASSGSCQVFLPTDHVISKSLETGVPTRVASDIPDGWMGLDIGPDSRMVFTMAIAAAGTVLWNGPMGVSEIPEFAEGTRHLANAVSDATEGGTVSIIGGGDTAAAVNKFDVGDRMSHVSTGGGASLELLEGRILPGVAALTSGQ